MKKDEIVINKEELKAFMDQSNMVIPKNIGDKVMNSIISKSEQGRLTLPSDYNVGNALLAGWVAMQDAENFKVSTELSRIEALVDMSLMAHYPKKHGYFIVYATKMTWFPKYTGKVYTVNRALGIEISAQVIYEKDDFSYEVEDGVYFNIIHKQELKNIIKGEEIGAYAIARDEKTKDVIRAEVMTMVQVRESWSKSKFDKDKKLHTEEFIRRSVYNRITKWFMETKNIVGGLIDVARDNENKHYDYTKGGQVIDGEISEITKEIGFEEKKEVTPHNEATGEVTEVETRTDEEILAAYEKHQEENGENKSNFEDIEA